MKKQEALKYIKEQRGFVPYISMFELWNDEDSIPQELIDLSCKPEKLKNNWIICNAKVAEELNKINNIKFYI